METFAAQMSALKEYRSKGEQKMTVQHVHVAEGGQAIVGNVNARFEGIGARKKSEDQPHALAYAPGVEMPRQIEAERVPVPSAGGAGAIASVGCTGPPAGLLGAIGTPSSTENLPPRRSP